MNKPITQGRTMRLMKTIGPGLLFASAAIGTSHLVLSTRAGAHHGMVYFWIILAALILKYPFYEYGPRYAAATGYSLLKGYKDQGVWAIGLFFVIVTINMFAVVGAVGAVAAGLLSSMGGMSSIPMPYLLLMVLLVTAFILLIGRYSALDRSIKVISVVLLITIGIAFVAVLLNGQVTPKADFVPPALFEGAGLALFIGLIGFMPSGMETSTMHSFWILEKSRDTGYTPTLKESLFDFNLGYIFTVILALMFLTIGAFTVYGSGTLLEGNSTEFANMLLSIFTQNLGEWTFPIIALGAFVTIYGTLITAWDAFARSFVRCLRIFKFGEIQNNQEHLSFLKKYYNLVLPIIGIGGFLLFYFAASSMITILQFATVMAFVTSPVIGWLNLRSILSDSVDKEHRPGRAMIILSYVGLAAMIIFTIYYLFTLL